MVTLFLPQKTLIRVFLGWLRGNQKSIIRMLAERASRTELGMKMRTGGLHFQLGLTVSTSGQALITIVTQEDPDDRDWSHATAIVRQIVGKKLGGMRLRSRSLMCAMANAPIVAAEITHNALDFDTRS